MFTSGDDAGHCSNGLTAQKFREATPEERKVYRKWLRGMVLVYGTLLLMSGVAAVASYSVSSADTVHQTVVAPCTGVATHQLRESTRAIMSWVDGLGFCASLAVLASFCMTTIGSLRMFALASNVLFSTYGLLAHIYPVVFLHMILLPINLLKLWRQQYRKAAQA